MYTVDEIAAIQRRTLRVLVAGQIAGSAALAAAVTVGAFVVQDILGQTTPFGGIATATVILPGLSREHAESQPESFSDTLNWALKVVIAFGVPATVALVYLSDALIATLFYQGEMTGRDVSMSGAALAAYGAGLLGHMWVKVLAPGYFARQNTSTPVKYGVIALVSNMVLNLMLVWHLQHVGLALATSISAFLNAGLLFFGLYREGILRLNPGWMRFLVQVGFAGAAMLLGLHFLMPGLETWLADDFFLRLGRMLLICLAGSVIYAAALLLSGVNLRELVR